MKILFVTEQFPYPLDTGGNVRTFNLLKGLARAHEVSLIAAAPAAIDEGHRREVANICRDLRIVSVKSSGVVREGLAFAASLARRTPFLLARHVFEAVRREVAAAFAPGPAGEGTRSRGRFEAVHFNHLDAALYQAAVPAGVHGVLDEHNVVANQVRSTAASEQGFARRMVLSHEYRKLRRFEAEACNRMARCLVCSAADAQSLQELGVTRPIAVIPNGVDLAYFTPAATRAAHSEIVFVGTLDYAPCERGLWYFCKEILPLLHSEMPALRFAAVGRNPSPRLLALARLDARIEFTGRVDDVRPYVRGARAFVVPLLSGSGTRLKILEAFALGAPVVSTTIGAEGIEGVPGEHLLVADEPRQFARSVLELLR
ncbi:MAG: glycosyltransferase, partial [Steroidobacteraceae bacterium]